MTIAFYFQFVDAKTNDPVGNLPVNVTFKYPPNYFGTGAGQNSFTATTDGNGAINFDETDLNTWETNGTDTVVISTPQTPSDTPVSEQTAYSLTKETITTFYNTGYRSTNNTYVVGSQWDNKTYTKTILLQPYQNTSVKTIPTGGGGSTITTPPSGGTYESGNIGAAESISAFFSGVSNDLSAAGSAAQTDIEIIAIVGALVAVIVIIVLLMKAKGSVL